MVNPIALPNNLDYTIASAKDAKARGFKLLLDFHYSDDWADPGHQIVRAPGCDVARPTPAGSLRVHARHHCGDAQTACDARHGAGGQRGDQRHDVAGWKVAAQWQNFADLLLAGFTALIRERLAQAAKIMIHIDKGGNQEAPSCSSTTWRNIACRTTWSASHTIRGAGSLDELKSNLAFVWNTYHKSVVLAETAYDWRSGEDFKGKQVRFRRRLMAARLPCRARPRSSRDPGGKVRASSGGSRWLEARLQARALR